MDIALSLVMLALIALVVGAVFLLRRGVRKQAWLMLLLALVMAVNVAVWTWPTESGQTLRTAAPGQ